MRRLLCRLHREQRGAVLVLVSLALVALVVMLALAIDGGYAYAQRRRMQNAADAAAMAGARTRALGGNDAQVEAAITQYAMANGADGTNWTCPDGQTVRVTVWRVFPTFFAGIAGLPQMTASATAEASVQYLSAASGLLPMIIKDQPFVLGQSYVLWGNDPEAPGNFGWVNWDGPPVGNSELVANITNPGNSGYWRIGDWVPAGPGVMDSTPVRDALSLWIGQHVTVPLYDIVQESGSNSSYHIAAFGEFVLEAFDFRASNKWVRGHFIRWVESGPGGGPNRGLSSIKLTR